MRGDMKRNNALEVLAKGERRVRLPGAPQGPANWNSVNAEVLRDTIQTVAVAGGAIRFGFTRDGGAYSIGVYGDGDPYTLYCSPGEDPNTTLRAIRDGFDSIANSAPRNGNGHQ